MSAFFQSAKSFWLVLPACAAAFFLAGTTLPGCNSSKEPTATAKQLEDVQAALRRVEGEVIRLRQGLPQATGQNLNSSKEPAATAKQLEDVQAALRRVEGEVIRLRQGLPQETEQELMDLENSLNDRQQWPQSAQGAEQMRQRLDEIVQALSPVAAERILPQLVRLNWGVEALWNLRTHAKAAPNQLEEAHAAISEVLHRHPAGQFPEIQKELESRLTEIDPQLHEFQVKQLLQRASRALEGKEDASAVFSSLEEFRGKKEVAEILPKLRSKVLEQTAIERIEELEKNLVKTRSFVDERARQVSLLTIQDGVLRLTVDLELEEAAPKDVLKKAQNLLALCDKELLACAAKQQDESAEKVRRYQAWALEQIRAFDSREGWYYDTILPWVESELKNFKNAAEDKEWLAFQTFPSMKDLVHEKVGVDLSGMKGAMLTAEKRKEIYNEAWQTIGWKNSIHTEIAYRATRDGMVKFLLPIQPHLLEPPVAQLYQQAFAKGWQKLEGRDDQLYVAQQSAVVQKKTLEEVASSNP
jgi:hypothetical protein